MLANQEMIEDDKNTFLFSVIECRVHRVQKPPSLSMLQITGTVSPSQVLTLKFTNSMIWSLPFVWPKYLHTHNLFPPQFSKLFFYIFDFSLTTARNNKVTLHSNYKPGWLWTLAQTFPTRILVGGSFGFGSLSMLKLPLLPIISKLMPP